MSSKDFDSKSNSKKEKSQNHFLLGALIGGVAGAIAALLLTPKSGKMLRSTINNQTETLKDRTGTILGSVATKGTKLTSKTSSLTQGIVKQSNIILKKVKPNKMAEEKEETKYISLGNPSPKKVTIKMEPVKDSNDIRRKLEEAQKAFDEEEYKVKH